MTDIEQEARAEAEKYKVTTNGHLDPGLTVTARIAYQAGYIAGASRPASPATREAVAQIIFDSTYDQCPELGVHGAVDAADALIRRFITEKGADRG